MRENFAESHVNWNLALWGKEWAWEHSGVHIKECWKYFAIFRDTERQRKKGRKILCSQGMQTS